MQKHTYEATINYKSKKPLDGHDIVKIKTPKDLVALDRDTLYIVSSGQTIIVNDKEHQLRFAVEDKGDLIATLNKVVTLSQKLSLELSNSLSVRSLSTGEKDKLAVIEEESVVNLMTAYYAEQQYQLMPADLKVIVDEFVHVDSTQNHSYENALPQKPSWMFETWRALRGSSQELAYSDINEDDFNFIDNESQPRPT